MESFITGLLIGFGVALPIGPLNILIMNYSLSSFKQGFALGFGAMSADVMLFLLSSAGVLVLLNHGWVLKILAIFGSAFLLYMAYSGFKNAGHMHAKITGQKHEEGVISCYIKGLLLNSINPFVVGFWLSLSSVVSSTKDPLYGVFGVVIALFLWILGLSFAISKAKMLISDNISKKLSIFSAFLMLIFAILVIFNTFIKGA